MFLDVFGHCSVQFRRSFGVMQEHSSMSSKGRLLRVMAKQQIDSNRRGRFHKLKKSHLAPGGNIGTIWNLCILQLTSAHAFAFLRQGSGKSWRVRSV